MTNYYQKRKNELRAEAIEWQTNQEPKTWLDVAGATDYFTELGKRYGLLKEFKENGII